VLRQSLVLGLGVNHEWRFELIFASSNAGLETWNPQSLPLTKHSIGVSNRTTKGKKKPQFKN
jgi:hypothetical protein